MRARAFVVVAVLLASALAAVGAEPGAVEWRTDLAAATAEARAAGRPLMVVFRCEA